MYKILQPLRTLFSVTLYCRLWYFIFHAYVYWVHIYLFKLEEKKHKYTLYELPNFREWHSYYNPHTYRYIQNLNQHLAAESRQSTTHEIPFLCNPTIHYCINNTLFLGINQDQIHFSVSSILKWPSLQSSLSL
jgi:hypothetical protein